MSIHDRDEQFVPFINQCIKCKHLENIYELYCPAYPAGIPKTILFNECIHDTVLPDQEETIIWEKLEDIPAQSLAGIYKVGGQVNENLYEIKDANDFERFMNSKTCCLKCTHYSRDKCDAFPDGIPLDIMQGNTFHEKMDWRQNNDVVYNMKIKEREI
jgi:hypothetical protein